MAIEFDNPVVAGTTLIREAIQSQNYQPGTEGWQIAADGTAEFADLTIRSSDGSGNVIELENGHIRIYRGGVLVAEVTPGDGDTIPPGFISYDTRFGEDYQTALTAAALELSVTGVDVPGNVSYSSLGGGLYELQVASGNGPGTAQAQVNLYSATAPASEDSQVDIVADHTRVLGTLEVSDTTWTTWTPEISGGGTATFSTRDGWYSLLGDLVYCEGYFVVGTAGSGGTAVTMTLPFVPYRGAANRRQLLPGGGPTGPVAGMVFAGGVGAQLDRLTDGTGTTVTGASLTAGSVWTFNGWYRRVDA